MTRELALISSTRISEGKVSPLSKQHIIDTNRKLNQQRIVRAESLLTPHQQQLFRLIPFLFQYHHFKLPGYHQPLVPCGIVNYHQDAKVEAACQTFQLPYKLATIFSSPAFEGIYTIGSTASFGQNPKSDIDVWLVHDPYLNADELTQIRCKSDSLTQWFAQYHLEVNFYLVHPQQFKAENQVGLSSLVKPESNADFCLDNENSGSSQHWLLLEEFYRSQICLAGKPVAWWPRAEQSEEFLHLGDLRRLPASEYLGASLWHLYKGLTKPHKSSLKVLLLEVYASEYPKSHLITDELWQRLSANDFAVTSDAYFLMYEFIENYLISQKDERRLELVRRCFYLKSGIQLTKKNTQQDWRYQTFQTLVQKWDWAEELLITLDNCQSWHSGQLQWFNRQLNELMLGSYQTLLDFASRYQLNSRIRVDELGILSRKLHTYFNQDQQQIPRLNALWSENVNEKTLIFNKEDDFTLYRLRSSSLKDNELIHRSNKLSSLVAWACINNISVATTKWYQKTENECSYHKQVTALTQRLLPIFANQDFHVSKNALINPWHFQQLVLILNLQDDPTQDWLGQELMVDRMNANVFSLGRKNINMLASIDLIELNSWGEYHCHQFTGERAILELLSFIAPGLRRTQDKIPIHVVSFSKKLKSQLEQSVINLVRQLSRLAHHKESGSMLLQPLQIASTRYGIFFSDNQMNWQDLSDAKSLYQQYFKGFLQEIPTKTFEQSPLDKLPKVIQLYATRGVIQYFLRQQQEDVDVFVLDEVNQLKHFIQKNNNIADMVTKVSYQYVFEQHHSVGDRFNMPQFYRVTEHQGEASVAPFGVVPEQLTSQL